MNVKSTLLICMLSRCNSMVTVKQLDRGWYNVSSKIIKKKLLIIVWLHTGLNSVYAIVPVQMCTCTQQEKPFNSVFSVTKSNETKKNHNHHFSLSQKAIFFPPRNVTLKDHKTRSINTEGKPLYKLRLIK